MLLTNGNAAQAILRSMSNEQLLVGLRTGARKLAILGDPSDYQGAVNHTVGHPNEEMRETTRGRQFYAEGFARLRLAMETAMVDTYQELRRRDIPFDTSGINLLYFQNWQLPKSNII